jgi:serine phosphatase RsbU (regulator of sigma subunit)
MVGRPGSVLGVFPDVEFHDVDIHLDESTLVVAYTDGVSEARRNREQFGEERILELVGHFSGQAVDDVLKHLVDAVLEFGGRPNYDDIAAIAIRRATKEAGPAND